MKNETNSQSDQLSKTITEGTQKTEKSSKKHKKKKHKSKSKHKKSKGKKDRKAGDIGSTSSSDWSAGDRGVDYGSAGRLTDGSDVWEGRSQELYESDNPPDYPLNSYHLNSKPRIVQL